MIVYTLRGESVLIGVHKDIPAYSVPVFHLHGEHIFVHYSYGNSNFIIGGTYFPPLSPSHKYESHITYVELLF